jgi:hypothetical protein
MEGVTAYDIAIIGGGFAVVGALVGGLVAYWFTVQLEHRKLAQVARVEFRVAFAPTIAFIYIARHHGTHDRPDIDAHIKGTLLLHGSAVELFRRFVASERQDGYQEAWEKYRKSAAMGHEDRIIEEWGESIDGYEVLLEKQIHTLLHYADA